MGGFFPDMFTNKIVLSVIVAYTVASLIKVFFNYLMTEKLDPRIFFSTGGMPSTHTASVTAMTSAIYFIEGVSNLFVVAFIVSIVIITDAVGIRRAAGKQAQVLNAIIEDFTIFKKFKTKRLYELLGHSPKQVIVGLILGIIVARIITMA